MTHNRPLLFMACSATKRRFDRPARFVDVYNGPIWQQARRYPAECIAALSARYGVLEPLAEIEHYDQELDATRLRELIAKPGELERFRDLVLRYRSIIVAGGRLYREFTDAAMAAFPYLKPRVRFFAGTYLQQRKLLSEFLAFAGKPELEAVRARELEAIEAAKYRPLRRTRFGELTLDLPPAEPTPAGEQFLIPGVAPVTDVDRLKLKAAAPLAPAAVQKPCNLGLFDDGARDQLDLVEMAKQKGPKL